jgi:hypothetical protein
MEYNRTKIILTAIVICIIIWAVASIAFGQQFENQLRKQAIESAIERDSSLLRDQLRKQAMAEAIQREAIARAVLEQQAQVLREMRMQNYQLRNPGAIVSKYTPDWVLDQ